jgi:hypothetical protein
MADVLGPEMAGCQLQFEFIGHDAEDEMGMVACDGDQPPATGLQSSMDRLNCLLGKREIRAYQDVDVSDLQHDLRSPGTPHGT